MYSCKVKFSSQDEAKRHADHLKEQIASCYLGYTKFNDTRFYPHSWSTQISGDPSVTRGYMWVSVQDEFLVMQVHGIYAKPRL